MPEGAPDRAARARTLAAGAMVAAAATSPQLGLSNPFLVLAGVFTWRAWRSGALRGRPLARPLLPPLLLFAAASVASAAFSLDPVQSLQKLPRLIVLLLVPLAAALMDREWWPRLVAAFAVVTTILAVWGIVQYLQGADNLARRIHGPMSHYMLYAGWVLLGVCVVLGELLLNPSRRLWLLLPPALLGSVALLLSFTRNAWVGLAAGLLLLAAIWHRRLLLLYPIVALALWFVFPRPILERVISIFDLRQAANYDRVCMTISGTQMVRDFPLTGVGLDMVGRLYPLYRRDDAPRWQVPHLHNNLVQIAAERGLPALAAYLWLIGAFFTVTWRGLPRLSSEGRAAVAATLTAVLAITVAGLFEYNFWFAVIQYPTLVLMGAGVGRVEGSDA
ncbi:MAG TPA: O-antigen ligase family protein [Thermoanaerobaculaceae bacterium]|nr:O-antigen ligase family protein [Thermoanaerobaculaceae bacterium]